MNDNDCICNASIIASSLIVIITFYIKICSNSIQYKSLNLSEDITESILSF